MNTINAAGLALIKKNEGLNLTATTCVAGVWTIGWGHTGKVDGKPVCKGMTITKAKAEEILKADVAHYWAATNDPNTLHLCRSMSENQLAALCSLAMNCGTNCLSSISKITNGKGEFVRWRTLKEVGNAIPLYNKATVNGKKQVVPGLADRRAEEKALYFATVASPATAKKDLPTIRRNDVGTVVAAAQALLNASNADHLFRILDVDGEFGPLTEAAVKAFQEANVLTVDGIVGPKTWKELIC